METLVRFGSRREPACSAGWCASRLSWRSDNTTRPHPNCRLKGAQTVTDTLQSVQQEVHRIPVQSHSLGLIRSLPWSKKKVPVAIKDEYSSLFYLYYQFGKFGERFLFGKTCYQPEPKVNLLFESTKAKTTSWDHPHQKPLPTPPTVQSPSVSVSCIYEHVRSTVCKECGGNSQCIITHRYYHTRVKLHRWNCWMIVSIGSVKKVWELSRTVNGRVQKRLYFRSMLWNLILYIYFSKWSNHTVLTSCYLMCLFVDTTNESHVSASSPAHIKAI